jgi:Flp pilus assembly protein CpaB
MYVDGVVVVPSYEAKRPAARRGHRTRNAEDVTGVFGGPLRGGNFVKKQTLVLVVIGVILFIAGGAIAYASVEKASKQSGSPTVVTGTSTSAVVAKQNIPAGTTGQTMVSQGLVALELVPTKTYTAADLQSLQALTDEVLTAPVQKGSAITSTALIASTSSISVPKGLDAMTVSLTGAADLAGYLQPGAHVDVYANITKISTSSQTSSTLALPCTELAMANIQVLDVSQTAPSLAGTKGSAGRTIPSGETMLLALTPSQARSLEFLTQNEAISVVQTQQDTNPPPVSQCIGTDQTTSGP